METFHFSFSKYHFCDTSKGQNKRRFEEMNIQIIPRKTPAAFVLTRWQVHCPSLDGLKILEDDVEIFKVFELASTKCAAGPTKLLMLPSLIPEEELEAIS